VVFLFSVEFLVICLFGLVWVDDFWGSCGGGVWFLGEGEDVGEDLVEDVGCCVG